MLKRQPDKYAGRRKLCRLVFKVGFGHAARLGRHAGKTKLCAAGRQRVEVLAKPVCSKARQRVQTG